MKAKLKYNYACIDIVVEAVSAASFPLDMLRYDNCTPYDERTAHAMADHHFQRGDRVRLRRFVLQGSPPAPTFGRWQANGWRVLHHHEMEQYLNGNPMQQAYPDNYDRNDAMPLGKGART